jgi:hypothetical protein
MLLEIVRTVSMAATARQGGLGTLCAARLSASRVPLVRRTHSGVTGRVSCERPARPFLLRIAGSGQRYAFELVKRRGGLLVG